MSKISLVISYIFLFSISCVDYYKVPDNPYDAGILVIDGFINSGAGSVTTINLSRSTPLSEKKVRSELNAKITLEGNDNSSSALTDKGKGTYQSTLTINQKVKYRMRIKTSGGKEFLSDFVEVKQTPPIDSITLDVDQSRNGLEIQLNAHDSKNTTRSYLWEYTETWEYHAECIPPGPAQTYMCWKSVNSNQIFLFSNVRLSEDVVSRFPLIFIDANSQKQYFTYSLLVKQYALTEGGMDYLQQLKKNTEQLGSIFDAQPSQLTGNFHSLNDPDAVVIGYLRIQNVTEKRIFIRHPNLPQWFNGKPVSYNCIDVILGDCIRGADAECLDCRIAGGVNVKPDFWIY